MRAVLGDAAVIAAEGSARVSAATNCSKKCAQPLNQSPPFKPGRAEDQFCVTRSSSFAPLTKRAARSASSHTRRIRAASARTPGVSGMPVRPRCARAAVSQIALQLASDSSRGTAQAARALARSDWASERRSPYRSPPASLTIACTTKSSSDGAPWSEFARCARFGLFTPRSAMPLSSSSLIRPSGKTTADASDREVPRFNAFPTARLVLIHFRNNLDLRNAWQQTPTSWNAKRRSLSSRAEPTSRAPHSSFCMQCGTVARTHKYRSGASNCVRLPTGRANWRSCSSVSCCS
mmetsp:Transcript_43437/g.86190  ORF Transcript_43437/g.86190 Transcript_43437/m.86190 type:complete len:292 (-) Transcript_43437:527-1402(-)